MPLPPGCIAALPPDHRWKCALANFSYTYSTTAFFLLQSALDLYQLFAIEEMGGWDAGCLNRGAQFKNCSAVQVVELQQYSVAFLRDLRGTPTFSQPGQGGFVSSCIEHQAALQSSMFDGYTIGGVTMQQALARWWAAPATAPSAWQLPCTLTAAPPHQCNPTCVSVDADADTVGAYVGTATRAL